MPFANSVWGSERPCRRVVRVEDHLCTSCGGRGPAEAEVTWVVYRAFGLPVRSARLCTRTRCLHCDATGERAGGGHGLPPLLHRFGAASLLALALAVIGVGLLALPSRGGGAPRVGPRDRAAIRRMQLVAEDGAAGYRARSQACLRQWQGLISKRFSSGLTTTTLAERDLPAGLDWTSTAVLPARPAAQELAQSYAEERGHGRPQPCDAGRVLPDQRRNFERDDLRQARARLARLQRRYLFNEPARMSVVDWACEGDTCTTVMAMIDADGKPVALRRNQEPLRHPGMGAAELRAGLDRRLDELDPVD
ncbi:MAG: hypothetical protein IT370_31585 [Deltaproteobacteria bacterium]|nr:hypothetical protein [Deltaproteobacteria bacterium]